MGKVLVVDDDLVSQKQFSGCLSGSDVAFAEHRKLIQTKTAIGRVMGSSAAIQAVCQQAEKIAKTDISTLLLGKSGTGKEIFARAIHEASPRADQPFIAINCASIPENLLESELFGYEKGAFTGANKTTIGKIEMAQAGTLFLDEIGDMPMSLQAKMLRFLQERVIERVGGRREINIDARIICATHRDLENMVAETTFREDLFYRVSEMVIHIPPLKDRENDVVLLAKTFLTQYVEDYGSKVKGFSENAVQALLAYSWPGNIRELQNIVKSAVILAEGPLIQAKDLSLRLKEEAQPEDVFDLRTVRQIAEAKAIRRAYSLSDGNVSKTASLLGVTRPTLYSLIEKYALDDLKTTV